MVERKTSAVGAVPFLICHLLVFAAIFTGVTWQAAVICAVLFVVRMWGVTAGYHRYFSHRTFKTNRVFQFFLAFLAQSSAQRGVLWWAAHHRRHHKYSDQEGDLHSPKRDGFWYSHVGWMFVKGADETDYSRIKDFAKYPELRFLNRFYLIPPIVLGTAVFVIWGASELFIGFFLSTVLLWHSTFFINSLCHVFGKVRFETKDTSKNSLLLALLTLGEGWHNNHHHYQSSARNGFYWWEIDITYYGLKALSWVGLVKDLRPVPERVLEEGRRIDAERKEAERKPAPKPEPARPSLAA